MNFIRLKRRIIHVFFMAALFVFAASPVFAVTVDIASVNHVEVVPVTKPLSLTSQKPPKPEPEVMGPQKPDEASQTPSQTPTPTQLAKIATPTATPTATPSLTLKPTAEPTAQATQPGSNTSNGGLNADVLFAMSNNYRAGLGLPPFQTDGRICSLAQARAPQIASEIAGGYMHAGKDSHNFPYHFTENIITMRTETEAFNWWVNDPIHHDAIVGNYTHSCVSCSGNACVQEFTSFQPK